MDTPLTPAPIPPKADVTERACITCGYPLRGLPRDGHCPECDTSIAFSLNVPSLADGGQAYLSTLAKGLKLVLVSIGLYATLLLCMAGMTAFPNTAGFAESPGFKLFWACVSLCLVAMSSWGYWLYASPHASQATHSKGQAARKFVRAVVVVESILALLDVCWAALLLSSPSLLLVVLAERALSLVALVLFFARFCGVLKYTQLIGTRIPDDRVASLSKRFMWLLPLLFASTLALSIFGAVLLTEALVTGESVSFPPLAVVAFGAVGPIISTILFALLLNRVRRQLNSILSTGQPARLPGRLRTGHAAHSP